MSPRPRTPQVEPRDVDRHSLVVPREETGARIDRYLAGVLPGYSRSRIQRASISVRPPPKLLPMPPASLTSASMSFSIVP